MPVYVYKCEKCGYQFDKLQSFSARPLTDCPQCDGHVHRVIQPVGVIFKGSGFYVTDNRSKSSTMPPTNRDESGAGEKKSDPKSATKSDSNGAAPKPKTDSASAKQTETS